MALVCSMEASFGISICTRNSPLSLFAKNSAPMKPPPTRKKEPMNKPNTRPNVVFLCANDHFRILLIQLVKLFKPFSKLMMILPKKVLLDIFSSLPKRDDNHGTMVNEESNDNNVAMDTVTQNCLMMSAAKPVLKAIGTNTTTITKVMDVTVNPISFVAS